MSASDWLVLIQTLVLAATIIPAVLALMASASASRREALASRLRDDLARVDRLANQVARLSVAAEDVQQGREHNKGRMQAEQLRLRALLAPFATYTLDALRGYATGDPTHASPEDIAAVLDEVEKLSRVLRGILDVELMRPPRKWWQPWRYVTG